MKRFTLLIVDDEEPLRELVVATLRHDGRYRIFHAEDGEEALVVAHSKKPDLVLLDVVLPKKDGYEVCRALRRDPVTADTKILMLSALAQDQDKLRGREAGADDYLSKPFRPTAMIKKVEQLLELSKTAGQVLR